MRIASLFAVVLVVTIFLSGCLTSVSKQYKFEFKTKNSGTLTIKYTDIMSKRDDDQLTKKEEVEKDFMELMDKYVNGDELEKSFPNAKVIKKELFEENGKLNAIIVFEFTDISQVNLYQYDKNSPYMYYLNSFSMEEITECNGKKGPDFIPVVFWDNKEKVLTLNTKITEESDECTSLLDSYKNK